MGERMGRVSSHVVSRWSRSPGCCGFRGVFWVRPIFFPFFFHEFAFSNSYIQSSQRRLDEGAPTASQSAHRELAPTYPHQVYRLVCSHLRNLASAVDQYSGRSQPASLIFDPTSECNVNKFFSSFESASRILSRERHHRWTYGRGTSRHVF